MNKEDLQKLIKREAPNAGKKGDTHDTSYATALETSWAKFNGLSRVELNKLLNESRERYRLLGATHANVADCLVLYELIEELKKWEIK